MPLFSHRPEECGVDIVAEFALPAFHMHCDMVIAAYLQHEESAFRTTDRTKLLRFRKSSGLFQPLLEIGDGI